MKLPTLPAALLVAAVLAAPPSRAGEGHDHGDAAPATVGKALPRFTAESEVFELVGVLDGKRIALYLDRFADNSPVQNARIELEIGGATFKAEKHGDDEYEVVLPEAPKAGVLPITAMVTAANQADLLAGELDIHEDAHDEEATPAPSWTRFSEWTATGLVASVLLACGIRRASGARGARAGGAA